MCDLIKMREDTGFSIESKETLKRTYNNMAKQLSYVLIITKKS